MGGLSDEELGRWHVFKRATDAVMANIERDIASATGLSGADFGVLDRLRLGQSSQTELATSLGWSRSRLSHQLTRMQQRGLLRRLTGPGSTTRVELSSLGETTITAALPVHAEAVRRHLLRQLTSAEEHALDRRAASRT